MNKKKVDSMIPYAVAAIEKYMMTEDKKDNAIPKEMRGYVSSFGAAVNNGSLLSAVMFFSSDKGSTQERSKITKAIYSILENKHKDEGNNDMSEGTSPNKSNIKDEGDNCEEEKKLFQYVIRKQERGEEKSCKEEILDAAIALKLAMNAFTLVG